MVGTECTNFVRIYKEFIGDLLTYIVSKRYYSSAIVQVFRLQPSYKSMYFSESLVPTISETVKCYSDRGIYQRSS